jgi:two-component sensor histidine kinase
VVISFYFGALIGLLLFALSSHLQIALKSGWRRQEVALLAGIVAIMAYSISTCLEYRAVDTGTYFKLLRLQVAVEPVIFISLCEFIFAEAGEHHSKPVIGFYAAFCGFTVLRLALPYTGVYTTIGGMQPYSLPWGETIELISGKGSALVPLSYMFYCAAIAIAAMPLMRMYRKGIRGPSLILLMAELVLLLGIAFDFAVALGLFRWFYVAEGTYVLLALFQCSEVTNHVVASSRLKTALERSLEDKSVLLAEVHHRVKNNLQVVASLLNLKAQRCSSGEAREALVESAARVFSIALVHEQLYSSRDFAEVDFTGFSTTLIESLSSASGRPGVGIEFKSSISGLSIGLESAVPLGIILNELVMNSIKHASREGQPLQIQLSTHHHDGRIVLEYGDNGSGFPSGRAPVDGEGMGLTLISALSGQLKAEGGFLPGGPGARFRIAFAADRCRTGPVSVPG